MIRIITALLGAFMLFTIPAQAFEIEITEADIQRQLDAKLPFSVPTKFNTTTTLLPGARIHFKGNGTIEMDGAYEISSRTKPLFRGYFSATTNLAYTGDALYLNRTALDDFNMQFLIQNTGDKWKDKAANLLNKGLEKTLNNETTIREIVALFLLKKLEEKPIYKFDGRHFWHGAATTVLTEDSFRVSENLLTIRVP